jgi:large subunit ribosomal protein L1
MKKHGKKYRVAAEKIEEGRKYTLDEGVAKVKEIAFAKFDETVELTMWLGVDPRKADQLVRGTVVLPHGLGKSKTVLVIAQGDKLKEAEEAGADFIGGEEMVDRIKGGWLEFDAVIATPDMMRSVGQLGKVLGPRGLMPNPKTGTVTTDVGKAVTEFKGGRVVYRTERQGANVHVPIGKASFESDALLANFTAVLDELNRAKPASSKGRYLKKVSVSSSMGPGVRIDPARTRPEREPAGRGA